VESYTWGSELVITGISLSDNTTWCDRDGYLDNGETGKLTVTIRNTGAEPLTRATVNVVSNQSGVIFPNGGHATFPTVNPLQSASVSIDVGLTTAFSPDFAQFLVSVSDPTLEVPRTIQGYNAFYVNTDEVLAATPFDSVDATNMVWTLGRDTTLGNQAPWRREVAYANGYYFGPDPSQGSDQYLISPPLNVSTGTNFGISFQHRFDFEADPVGTSPRGFYDGGRVELSNDGGATWTDLGPSLVPSYNGTLITYAGNVNPLKGQNAFVGQNPAYPGYDFVWADLGSAYAGQTVQVRFRVATDASAGAGGWEVDEINFSGIDNTPFAYLGMNQAQCVNRRPVANAGTAQTVNERATATLNGTASSDPDNDAITYAWTQTAGPAVALSGATTAQPTFTAPEVTADTALAFTLVVTDTAGNTSLTATTMVTVRNVNRAPVAIAPGASFDERGTAVLQGSGTDPDGDALTYAWTQSSGPAVTLEGADSARPSFATPEVSANTQLTFDLVVSDGALSSAPATATVTVRNVNRPPRGHAGATQTVPERSSVSLDGSASVDPDGDGLNYTWVQTVGPTVALSGAASASPTFTAPEVIRDTLLSFSLVVDDGQAASPAASMAILVTNVNRRPGVTAGADFSADERTAATLSSTGTDQDGDTLRYSWTQTGGPPVALSDAYAASPTFTTPEVRADTVLTFTVTVSDGADSSTATVRVQVRQVNRLPVISAGAAQSVQERSLVMLSGAASDSDGDALTYAWVQTSGPEVVLSDAHAARPSFIAPNVNKAGADIAFTLTVNDGTTSTSSSTQITVTDSNRQPRANAGANQTVVERGTATLSGTGSADEDGDELRYTWTQVSGTTVTLRNAASAAPSFDTPEVTADSKLVFKLVVNDGALDSAESSVEVLVKNVNRAPRADAGQSQFVNPGATVTLHGNNSSDPDATAVTYAWKQTSGPEVVLSDASAAEPTFQLDKSVKVGTQLSFELTVTDESGASSTSLVSVLVAAASGGCSVAGPESSASALFPVLFLGAALFLARRRRSA
ncbi:MAG TPA: tandem-95 repeat protein, partial [Myxococcaceae bacterium]|nr:tandem-95 repeat protein [Myxococcaceae bacterium]